MGGEGPGPWSCAPRPYLAVCGDFPAVRIQAEPQPFQVAQGSCKQLGIAPHIPLVPLTDQTSRSGGGGGGGKEGDWRKQWQILVPRGQGQHLTGGIYAGGASADRRRQRGKEEAAVLAHPRGFQAPFGRSAGAPTQLSWFLNGPHPPFQARLFQGGAGQVLALQPGHPFPGSPGVFGLRVSPGDLCGDSLSRLHRGKCCWRRL